MKHNCYPHVVDLLIYKILRHEGDKMTVFSDENYPQYLIYEGEENNGDSLRPMTQEDTGDPIEQPSFLELIKNIIINTFNIILEQLKKLFV